MVSHPTNQDQRKVRNQLLGLTRPTLNGRIQMRKRDSQRINPERDAVHPRANRQMRVPLSNHPSRESKHSHTQREIVLTLLMNQHTLHLGDSYHNNKIQLERPTLSLGSLIYLTRTQIQLRTTDLTHWRGGSMR